MLYQILFGLGRTQTYTVHEAQSHPTDRIDRADALSFVRDGFSVQAFIFGPLWLLMHRQWIGFGLYAAAVVAILAGNEWLGLPEAAAAITMIGLHALIGSEADTIERAGLEQRGWRSLGSVSGTSALDCERRFFETWLHDQPVLAGRETTRQGPGVAAAAVPTPAPSAATARGSVAGRLAALWSRT